WSSPVARQAHNLKVTGSNPVPATSRTQQKTTQSPITNRADCLAEAVPAELRGTAYGMFNLITGVALLLASVIAGGLWEWIGSAATFLAGAGFAALAALGLVPLRHKLT
ncbi:MAG: hypothetical protein WAT35_04955, partial [Tabrizicola sp.]